MHTIRQSFSVSYSYPVHFTSHVFDASNEVLKNVAGNAPEPGVSKFLFVVDNGVRDAHPILLSQIKSYCNTHRDVMTLCCEPLVIIGGEACKNDTSSLDKILNTVDKYGIDRHAYIVAVGGGAVIDLVGYAAAIAHRGIRHIRIPTTVLSQNDSGVGVKNGINAFGKKNFLGTFAPPYAVINDPTFLTTLDMRDWRSGIAEAVKVALIKDAAFFQFIQNNTAQLNERDMEVMQELIFRCAQLHLDHIASGDPFEMGSSRPLDFGHWASHKLEGLTKYDIRHGEAVAIGICLDAIYSHLTGLLAETDLKTIIRLMKTLGFQLYLPELSQKLEEPEHPQSLLSGLKEFREHLGGKLTLMMLQKIGTGVEVHEMDFETIKKAIEILKSFQSEMPSFKRMASL